jgi:hypothetical protein
LFLAGASGKDFPLVGSAGKAPAPGELPDPEPYLEWLRDGWLLRDKGWKDPGSRVPVAAYREFDEALLRAEQHWRGGTDAERIRTFLQKPTQRFQSEWRRLEESAAEFQPRSLAEVVARGTPPPDFGADGTLAELHQLAELDAKARGPKGEGKDKLPAERDRFLKKKVFAGKPFHLAWAVFEAACADRNPRPERALFWNDLLRAVPPRTPYAETQYLGRLAALADKAGKAKGPAGGGWSPEAVRVALLAARAEAQVAAGDAQALPWVEGSRAAAARERREGETALFGTKPDPGLAAQRLQRSLSAFESAAHRLKTVQEALYCRDDALALLPAYLPYLDHDPALGPTWVDAVEAARDLRDLLARPPGKEAPPAELFARAEQLTESLQVALGKLRKPFEPGKLEGLVRAANGGTASTWQALNALPGCSWLKADDRIRLWKASRCLSRELRQKTEALDQADDRAGQETAPLPAFDSGKAERREREQALRRADWSVPLLKLQGPADLKEVEGARARVRAAPADPAAWQALRKGLRQAWARGAPR